MFSEITNGENPSAGTLAYFETRTMHDWYDFVISKFLEEERAGRLTRAQLARRIKKSPAVMSRLLAAPSNWTLATLSNLLIGIAAEESVPNSRSAMRPPQNAYPDWAKMIEGPPPPPPSGLGPPRTDNGLRV